jgi:hypothetical protein
MLGAVLLETEKPKPKATFSVRLPNGDYIDMSVWPGKSDSADDQITVKVNQRRTVHDVELLAYGLSIRVNGILLDR